MPQAILVVAMAIFIFYLLSRIFDIWMARIFISLYIFDPLSILHSRVIQTDGLQSILLLGSILSLVYFIDRQYYLKANLGFKANSVYLVLSGLIGALAFLQKSPSIVIVPYVLGVIIFHAVYSKVVSKRSFKIGQHLKSIFVWLFIFSLSTYILYPLYWGNPVKAFQRMTIEAYQFGVEGINTEDYTYSKYVSSDLFALDYLHAFLYKNLEITIVGLILLVFLTIYFYRLRHFEHRFLYLFYIFTFSIGYILMLQISEKKFSRYIIVVTAPLIVLAAYGIRNYFSVFFKDFNNLVKIVLLLILGSGAFTFFYYMPDIGGYRNSIGVLSGYYNSDGGTGAYKLGVYLLDNYGPNESVSINDYTQLYLFYPGDVVQYYPHEIKSHQLIILEGYNQSKGNISDILVEIDKYKALGGIEFYIYRHKDFFSID